MSQPVYLLDASIYIFQAYFSPHLQICSKDGSDLSAFYGFAQFLLRFLRQTQPRYVAVAFDESLFCGFRHSLYPSYKSNRELPDESLARQLRACAELTELLGIKAFGSRIYEADDIIGTLAARARSTNNDEETPAICVLTRDKDLAQLLCDERDHLWDFHAGSRRFRKDILRLYGIRPEQFPDYLGLVGDAVDCIPGVPGIGPVAATSLLRHFESIPILYENLHEVSSLSYRGSARGGDLLRRYEVQAYLSRRLATIVQDVDEPDAAFAHVDITDLLWCVPKREDIARLLGNEGLEQIHQQRFMALLAGLDPIQIRSPLQDMHRQLQT